MAHLHVFPRILSIAADLLAEGRLFQTHALCGGGLFGHLPLVLVPERQWKRDAESNHPIGPAIIAGCILSLWPGEDARAHVLPFIGFGEADVRLRGDDLGLGELVVGPQHPVRSFAWHVHFRELAGE